MRILFISLITILLLFSCASNIKKEDLAREFYNLANAYFKAKDYKNAIQFYEKAIELDSSFSKAKFNYASSLIKNNEIAKSIAVLDELVKEDPGNASLLSLLGYAYHAQNMDDKALAVFENLLSVSPGNAYALYNSGIILWKLGKLDEAQKRFEAALALGQDDVDVLLNLGDMYAQQKNYKKAVEYLGRYLEKKPAEEKAVFLYARCLSGMMDYAPALDAYDQALTINPKNKEAWFEKADILLTRVKDPDKGIVALQQALDLGFYNAEQIAKLYNSPDIYDRDKVKKILEDKKLLPQGADANTQNQTAEPLSGTPAP